jgi:hypothetical protein
MLNIVKTTNLIIKRTPLVCGVLFAVLALLPISAHAQCKNWDASGDLAIIQRGQANPIYLTLEQKGRVITGGAHLDIPGSNGNFGGEITAAVDGTIDGDSFSVQLFWNNHQTGIYIAKVLPSGRLDGEGYEKRSPNIRVPWHSLGVLKCAPPAAPKPIKSSGKMPPKTPPSSNQPTSQPTKTAPSPPLKAPFIVAGQVAFPAPGYPTGSVVLTWDGGPDHPYAEVWVKIDSGDETFVVEQGKGARQVTVERGRQYLYILTVAGQTLATVTFIVPRD